MKTSLLKITALLGLSLALSGVGKALVLDSSNGVGVLGGPPAWGQSSWLFTATGADGSVTTGENYTVAATGTGALNDPFAWTVTFDFHPQLTGALMKTGGTTKVGNVTMQQYISWSPASVFAAFNASSDMSITFVQNVWTNKPGNAYVGISGLGLEGTAGSADDDIIVTDDDTHNNTLPDSTATVTLLGLALLGLGLFQRKFRA